MSEGQKQRFQKSYISGHLDRYTCEFDFIPNILCQLYIKGEIDLYIMTHPIEWRLVLLKKGVKSDFGKNNILITQEEKDDETRFIYTFPEPKKAPDCYYAILIIDKNKKWRYFTLEKDSKIFPLPDILIDSLCLVCEQKSNEHVCHSRWCKNELDEFKRHVQELLDNKPYDKYTEGIKFLDANKIAKMQLEMKICELIGLEDEFFEEKCSIF